MSQRFGTFEVLGRLGQGGMAEVLRVRSLSGPLEGRELALKRLLPSMESDAEAVARFCAEAALSRHLHHPNIVEVHEVGQVGTSHFIVMELIDGRDVGLIVKRCRATQVQWPIDFAVCLTKALLDALQYAHGAKDEGGQPLGVVHCDVSPSNFFVSRTGDLKLGDFGVARSFIESGPQLVMGKPYYLSPEALRGTISPQTDLWAVGVTLYELLTLRRPFQGRTPEEVFEAIGSCRFKPVKDVRSEVPAVIDELLLRAFHRDPHRRFATAKAFGEALNPLYDERVGTPLAISAVVRGLFGTTDGH